jgi:hypothetical protein
MSILLSILIACGGDATETTEVAETTTTETTTVVETTTTDNGETEEVTTETNVTNVTEDAIEIVVGDNETIIVND